MPAVKDLRTFGLMWCVILTIIGLWPYLFSSGEPNHLLLVIAAGFGSFAVIWPQLFHYTKLFQLWMAIAHMLGKINSMLVIFLMFLVLIVPAGIIMKLLGKDPLTRKWHKEKSYFVNRDTQPGSMKNQF